MDRPLERRTSARTAVVWDAVRSLLTEPGSDDGQGAAVLDIGGGTGGLAVRVAALGHRVTVVDPSPDALAALARRADEEGVADRVTGVQGDLGDLGELRGSGSLGDLLPETGVDLVLCHGVLGLLDDPAEALATIASALRPKGTLSLVVNQRHAAVLARAVAGHFAQARDILEGEHSARDRGERRFTAEEVTGLLTETGFTTSSVHGIRVFTDLVPSSLLDLEPGAGAALLELERAVSTRPEYLTVAGQLHVLATS